MENSSTIKLKNIFLATLFFLSLVWLLNLSQYLVVAAFLVFSIIISLYLKNVYLGLAVVSLIVFCVQTGKTYEFLLLPPGTVSPERFPYGYSQSIVFGVNHVVSVLLGAFILNGLITGKYKKVKIIPLDILVFSYYSFIFVSATLASSMPDFSIIYALLSFAIIIKYIFFRLNYKLFQKNKLLLISAIAAMLLFECGVALIQFARYSPTARSIDAQKSLEVFGGGAVDEMNFVFRPLGTFVHANYLAAYIALVAPVVLGFSFIKSKAKYFSIYIISIVVSGITLSRGGWLALLPQIGLFFSGLLKKLGNALNKLNFTVKILISIAILVLSFSVVLPRVLKSLNINTSDLSNGLGGRLLQFENSFQLVSLHPFLGVGPGMNVIEGYKIEPRGIMWSFPDPVHNVFLLTMVELGIPAFLIYVMIFGYLIYTMYSSWKFGRKIENSILAKGLFSGIIGAVIVGMLQPFNFIEPVLLLSLILLKQ